MIGVCYPDSSMDGALLSLALQLKSLSLDKISIFSGMGDVWRGPFKGSSRAPLKGCCSVARELGGRWDAVNRCRRDVICVKRASKVLGVFGMYHD